MEAMGREMMVMRKRERKMINDALKPIAYEEINSFYCYIHNMSYYI